MEDKQRYQTRIEGRPYTIVGHRSPQHMDAVVQLLTQQLDQLKQLDPTLSVEDRAILMAINAISDQLVKERALMDLENKLDPMQRG